VLTAILELLDKPRSLIRHIEDRPGHDRRYSLDSSKVRALGWTPQHGFEAALETTVRWYVDNRWWWEKVRSGAFRDYYDRLYGDRLAKAPPPS
jgi:dTDP-glucose 4,6-dehydratase